MPCRWQQARLFPVLIFLIFFSRSELLLSYFCGYGPGCSDPKSVVSLQKAKVAVEQQYSVVGVSEMRNISLRVMEAYLIFVIFLHMQNFLENKIYTEIYTVNCKFAQ